MSTVAITGTGGYLGGRLAHYLADRGIRVVRMSRSAAQADLPFDLSAAKLGANEFSSRKVGVLVHAAYDFSCRSRAEIERVNVKGTLDLFESALAGGVKRILFVSSLAAHPECRSFYGKAKYAIEGWASDKPVVILKPGTVYGPGAGGMMGGLTAQLENSRLLMPVISHSGKMYLSHEADLFELIETMMNDEATVPSSPLFAASETPWTLKQLCQKMKHSIWPVLLPVPWWGVWVALRTVEAFGGRPRFRSDSALSLGHPASAEYIAGLTRPSSRFREFTPESLAPTDE